MINTIYATSNTASFGGYTIYDIFNKNISLNETQLTVYSNWFYTLRIDNGVKLEDLAYKIYSNINVWDVIFVLNEMDSVFDLPKSDDYIYMLAEQKLELWLKTFPNTSSSDKNVLLQKYIDEATTNNEKHRYLKIIYPQYLPNFRSLLNA